MSHEKSMIALKKALVWCEHALLIFGFCALGYCASVFVETTGYQHWAYQQLREGKTELREEPPQIRRSTGDPVQAQQATPSPSRIRELSPLARIEIPRLGLSAMVAEGVTPRVLKLAVGHVPDTALPGQAGNIALAGHRDTFFRRLGDLKTGDVIELTTSGGQYQYVVRFTEIVRPDEIWVLDPSARQTLTLITCYPFHFIGAAPKRFIVRARAIESSRAVESSLRRETRATNPVSYMLKGELLAVIKPRMTA
ncbi:MAG: class D sortase [Terriglobales bacterium]